MAGIASATAAVKKGHRGSGVRRIQRRLDVTADGVFGSGTERAVKRFQRKRGLEADGVVGPITRRALGLKAFARGSVYRKASQRKKRRSTAGGRGARALLERIAECESGGDPTAVSSSGQYRGKYQFLRSTWKANGGSGDPAEAGEAEQDRIAMKLYRAEGIGPWPVCGPKAR